MNFPVGLTSSAIRPVVFHSAAKEGLLAQESRINRILTALVVAGSPWLAIVLFKPEELFGLILGDTWARAGVYAAVIAVPVFLFALRNWMDRILDVAGRQDLNLMVEFVSAVTSLAGLAGMLASGSSVFDAVVVQSSILAVNYAIFMFIAFQVAGYRVRVLYKFAAVCAAIVAVFLVLYQIIGSLVPVPFDIAVAVTIAIIFSGATGWSLFRRLE
jgi:O-antigen/teichoic acid export membrane protein